MEEYVKKALTASYARPGDDRPAVERFREVSKYGHETIISELFCAAADCLPHVRDIATEHPDLPVELVSVGSSPFWLIRCLLCLEPSWTFVAFDFSGLHPSGDDQSELPEPTEEQRLGYDKMFDLKIENKVSRHYIIVHHSITGRTLHCFLDMLASFRKRCRGEASFEYSVVQLREGTVAEEATVQDLKCEGGAGNNDDVSLALGSAEAVPWVRLKAASVVGLCGCDLPSLGGVVPRGIMFYPCDWWGRSPLEAEDVRDAQHDRFVVHEASEFHTMLDQAGVVGAADIIRASGNKLFTAEQFEEAAVAYVNARLYLEKVIALTKGKRGINGVDGELASADQVRSCKLACATNAAACYLKVGRLDECMKTCDDALSIDPRSVKANFRKAQVYLSRGNTVEAEKTLRKALEYAPDDLSIKKELVKLAQLKKKDAPRERELAKKMFG